MSRLFLEAEEAKAKKAIAEGRKYTKKTLYQLWKEASPSPNISNALNSISIRHNNTRNSLTRNVKNFQNSDKALLSEVNSIVKKINKYAELAQNLTKNSNSITKKKLTMNLKEAVNKLKTLKNKLNKVPNQLEMLKARKNRLYSHGGKQRTHRRK